jgi:peptide/nickel transport system permease protein
MLVFVLRRGLYMILTAIVASFCLFLLFELDPTAVVVDVLGPYSTQDQRLIWLSQNGYNDPFMTRYLAWLLRFASGDFGQSRIFHLPVASVIWPSLGNTAILGLCFLVIMVPLALGLGVVSGMREGSRLDRVVSTICITSTSIPTFATTVLVSAVLVFYLGLLPGTSSMLDGFSFRELVMPVLVLVTADFGYVARITRAAVADVMMAPYIRTALLKGLPYRRVILRHVLRSALIAPFTVIMLHINWLIAGVVVVEFFFAYKGFGSLIVQASLNRDLYLLEACTVVAVAISVTTQTIADIGYTFLNPRIRFR